MGRRLPTPRTPAEEYAAVTYELLGELVSAVDRLTVMLRDRLPSPEGQRPVVGSVRLTEPDRPAAPDKVSKERMPGRLVEPAVPAPAPLAEPEPVPEPVEPEPESRVVPDPPPRAGRGSSLAAWQTWANQAGVPYGPDDKRDDIIAAAVAAGVLPEGV